MTSPQRAVFVLDFHETDRATGGKCVVLLFCVHLEVFEYFWTPKKMKWTYIYKNETTSDSALNAHSHDGGNDLSLHIKEEAQSPQTNTFS